MIGVPDPRWDERPLACVVTDRRRGPEELREFLADHIAKWQVPENWAFIDEVPKTSVGKFDKKVLRTQYENGDLTARTGVRHADPRRGGRVTARPGGARA